MEQSKFIARLVALRMNKGVSARNMSLSIGQSPSYRNNIEAGMSFPSMTGFFYIREYLGITPKEFFDTETVVPTKAHELMDAAKGQYIHFLPDILRLMPIGGLLVSDNILQDGDILESRYAVTRRDRTIHGRMREYLYTIKHHDQLRTDILPIGDGVTVSVRMK